jgi:hypothetical protein
MLNTHLNLVNYWRDFQSRLDQKASAVHKKSFYYNLCKEANVSSLFSMPSMPSMPSVHFIF